MAKHLPEWIIDELHVGLTRTLAISGKIALPLLAPYFASGDYCDYLTDEDLRTVQNNHFVLALLILAAEEELDGYPMEAVSE